MSEEKLKVPRSWQRIRWMIGLLLVAMVGYVAWNADWTDYENPISGRTGMLSWERHRSGVPTQGMIYVNSSTLTGTLLESLIHAIGFMIDIYERFSGGSRGWAYLEVSAEGDRLRPEDIRRLPNYVLDFKTNGLEIDPESARLLTDLNCSYLEISHVNQGDKCLIHFNRLPSLRGLTITSDAFNQLLGITKTMMTSDNWSFGVDLKGLLTLSYQRLHLLHH